VVTALTRAASRIVILYVRTPAAPPPVRDRSIAKAIAPELHRTCDLARH